MDMEIVRVWVVLSRIGFVGDEDRTEIGSLKMKMGLSGVLGWDAV